MDSIQPLAAPRVQLFCFNPTVGLHQTISHNVGKKIRAYGENS